MAITQVLVARPDYSSWICIASATSSDRPGGGGRQLAIGYSTAGAIDDAVASLRPVRG
ncbi:hypothetical protein JF767_20840 [Mycobacterium intracellulare subsp. chimaera]|nr:hypothetical protein [Mycobacterium intracellulare subsp. chimaera]MCA2353800.1 hypothetical protein [Mycobacterium intracellulare subsp. chimaera]QGK48806.1 hypothetical protein GJE02_14110 [Mycobacterium intracellulare subsp. chimaera]